MQTLSLCFASFGFVWFFFFKLIYSQKKHTHTFSNIGVSLINAVTISIYQVQICRPELCRVDYNMGESTIKTQRLLQGRQFCFICTSVCL